MVSVFQSILTPAIMKTSLLKPTLSFLALIFFNLLFWGEKLGLNLFLFSLSLLILSRISNPFRLNSKESYFAVGSYLVTGIMVVVNNTGISIFTHIIAFFIVLIFFKQEGLKTVYDGIIGFLKSYLWLPVKWWYSISKKSEKHPALARSFKFFRLAGIPILVFIVFFQIYRGANPKFEALTQDFTVLLSDFFSDLSFGRIVFLIFGFSFISLAVSNLYKEVKPSIEENDELKRKKKIYNRLPENFQRESLVKSLLNEYRVGILILVALNVLLLIVNVIDLTWVYAGFEVPKEFNLKQFVHEGTYLLILSILLSIAIVLYFFRGSLNFYPKNKILLWLGRVWIIQNAFLTLSVFMRNFHYINYHGLASKRIGMIAFLIMTIFGLLSLIVKINQRKSAYFLLRVNTWFIFLALVSLSFFNWDRIIVSNNLAHHNPAEIDIDHYLELDPTLSPLILSNIDTIEMQMIAHRNNEQVWVNILDIDLFKEKLLKKTKNYLNRQKDRTWASWNVQDRRLRDSFGIY